MDTTTTHPYYVGKAREAFIRAGGNPDKAGPLAVWAQTAHQAKDTRRRVVVAEDGELLAETRRNQHRVTASYVTSVTHDRDRAQLGSEEGLALGALRRSSGRQVIVVTYSDVCTGPAVRDTKVGA